MKKLFILFAVLAAVSAPAMASKNMQNVYIDTTTYLGLDIHHNGGKYYLGDSTYSTTGVILSTYNIDMNTHRINEVGDPTSAQDAATKAYVDASTAASIGGILASTNTWTGQNTYQNTVSISSTVAIGKTWPNSRLDVDSTGVFGTGLRSSYTDAIFWELLTGNDGILYISNDEGTFGSLSINDNNGEVYAREGNFKTDYGVEAATLAISGAAVAATLNTGQGANELYDMNQNVLTTSDVTFDQLTVSSITITAANVVLTATATYAQNSGLLDGRDYTAFVSTAGDLMSGTLNMFNGSFIHFSSGAYRTSIKQTGDNLYINKLDPSQYIKLDMPLYMWGGPINMVDNEITNIDWANSDDGAGSGLDADMLDSYHATHFVDTTTVQNIAGAKTFTESIICSSITATDANGLYLLEDGGSGIFIADGGQVGIGTINPIVELDIYDSGAETTVSIRADNADDAKLRLVENVGEQGIYIRNDGGTNKAYIGVNHSSLGGDMDLINIPLATGIIEITTHTNILGNVGIGTSSPDYLATINQGSGDANIFAVQSTDVTQPMTSLATTNSYGIMDKASSANGGLLFAGYSDTDAKGLVLRGSIGATNPTDTTPAISITGSKYDGGTSVGVLGELETVLLVENNTTDLLTILGNGNVGIKTITPTATLHVVGTSSTTGNSFIGGDLVVAGSISCGNPWVSIHGGTDTATTLSAGVYTTMIADFSEHASTGDFAFSVSSITYTGTDGYFAWVMSTTITTVAGADTCYLGLAQNNAVDSRDEQYDTLANNEDAQITASGLVYLTSGDVLNPQIKSTGGANMIVSKVTLDLECRGSGE